METTMKLVYLKLMPILNNVIAVLWENLGVNNLEILESVRETH
jgi:hypothetical protein